MKAFSNLFRELDSTTGTNQKVAALRDYFRNAPPADAVWALHLLTGKSRKRIVTSRVLRQVFLSISDLPEWLFEESYAHVGDSAETIGLLLDHGAGAVDETLEQLTLGQWMTEQTAKLRDLDDDGRRALILDWWNRLGPDQIFLLNKILTGGFRVGVSQKLVIRGLARAFNLEEPVLAHRLMGDWTPTADFYSKVIAPDDGARELSQPYPFFLASPLEAEPATLGPPDQWLAEWKWDGIRAQVIRRQGQTFIWSRGEDLLTDRFPELLETFEKAPDGIVLDGELICWRDHAPLPFAVLQKRIGRKKLGPKILADAPAALIAYDLLEHHGQDLRQTPQHQRLALLDQIIAAIDHPRLIRSPIVTFDDWPALDQHRAQSRERGVEGLMLKHRDATYQVGRKRGHWWKYKIEPYTLDAVLIYAQAGSGRRANLFTDYTFALWNDDGQLTTFAKAYSGLDNQEIGELDRWIRRHTTEKFGPVRAVEPHHVFEIAFEGIAASKRHKSGVAVRFPRIHRWRRDKRIQDADTLQTALDLL